MIARIWQGITPPQFATEQLLPHLANGEQVVIVDGDRGIIEIVARNLSTSFS